MKDRIMYYSATQAEAKRKDITIIVGGKKESIFGLDQKYFDNKKERIDGFIHLKNREYSGDEYATLVGISEENIDIFSSKKFYEQIVGYIETTDGEYLAVTKNCYMLLAILLLMFVSVIVLLVYQLSSEDGVIPAGEGQVVEEDDSKEEPQYRMTADVILPDGNVSFGGTVFIPEDEEKYINDPDYKGITYTGKAQTEVQMFTEDGTHILLYSWKSNITEGILPDTMLDYTKLDFEVLPGIYDGIMNVIYENGIALKIPMSITIRSTMGGKIGIGYSDKVDIDLKKGVISLQYSLSNSPDDTYVEVIIQDGENEYILGKSNTISSGQTLTALGLLDSMKSRLEAGTYSGILRVYVAKNEDDQSAADIHSDIKVIIFVR